MSLVSSDLKTSKYDVIELLQNNEHEKIIKLLKNKAIVYNGNSQQTPLDNIITLFYSLNYRKLMDEIFKIKETHFELFLFFLKEIFKNLEHESFLYKLKEYLNKNKSSENNIYVHVLPYILYIYLQTNKISCAVDILQEYYFLLNDAVLSKLNVKDRFLLCYFSGLTLFLNCEYLQAFHFLKIAYLIFPVAFIESKLNGIANLCGYAIEISVLPDHKILNYFNKLWKSENELILTNFDYEKVLFFENYISKSFFDYKKHDVSKIYGIYAISENSNMNIIKCYCLIEFLIKNFGNYFLNENKMIIKNDILKVSYNVLKLNRSYLDDFLKLIYMRKINGSYDFKSGVFVIRSMDRGKFNF